MVKVFYYNTQVIVFIGFIGSGGEGGIRTHGTLQYAAFRVRYIRPLCHFSVRYIITAF